MTSEAIRENSADYGLVNHVPSGEVYVMRFRDGAVSGPLHHSEHREAMANAHSMDYDPEDTEWAKAQSWQPHNQDGHCQDCNA